eukprot:TRINITY_DN4712_c0_g1_i1.p1 TRINITY_DN4712_c0_g1~~TRINITY_DN4712_c0_g1_i1.p1  ORF type:complete len:273 (+),score=102.78 TRINITY_DN4712_c0_g1_i1:35-820(+)
MKRKVAQVYEGELTAAPESAASAVIQSQAPQKKPKEEIQVVSKVPRTLQEKIGQRRLIVVLESACLETVKVGSEFHLLNCDDHLNFMKRKGLDPQQARPDITHQCLLTLLDSPINKVGMLQVYIRTRKNVLIEVNPQIRIPRTFKRFSGLMVQLLHKLSIRASDGPQKLLKVIKNPVTDHLPPGCRKISTSVTATTCVNMIDFVPTLPENEPVVFIVGGFSHGHLQVDYADQFVSLSRYPMSASGACGRICYGFENHWGIL